MKSSIIVTWDFEAVHHFVGVKENDTHDFLRFPHRALFKCKAKLEVFHGDRELDLLEVKDFLKTLVKRHISKDATSAMSCEDFAKFFYGKLYANYSRDVHRPRNISVSVFENGENGAEVES